MKTEFVGANQSTCSEEDLWQVRVTKAKAVPRQRCLVRHASIPLFHSRTFSSTLLKSGFHSIWQKFASHMCKLFHDGAQRAVESTQSKLPTLQYFTSVLTFSIGGGVTE